MTTCRFCDLEIEEYSPGVWVDETIANPIVDPSVAQLCESSGIHEPRLSRAKMIEGLFFARQRDEDLRSMVDIICAAENCGLADLSDEQLELLYDGVMSVLEQTDDVEKPL